MHSTPDNTAAPPLLFVFSRSLFPDVTLNYQTIFHLLISFGLLYTEPSPPMDHHQSSSGSSSCPDSLALSLSSMANSEEGNPNLTQDLTQLEFEDDQTQVQQHSIKTELGTMFGASDSRKLKPGKKKSVKGKQLAVVAEDGKKLFSPVWKDFSLHVPDKPSGKDKSSCFHCGKTYYVDIASHGTSTLLTHTRRCKKHPKYLEMQKQSKLVFKTIVNGQETEPQLAAWSFDQAECRKALVRMLVLNEFPFRFVDSEGFKQFIQRICPMFVIPSRPTINRDVTSMFLFEKNNLKEYLSMHKPRVCLTTDTWTSVQQINYLCLTLHYIDLDWVLRKKIINFCPIVSHKGDDLGKSVEKCLIDWGIVNVLTVTVDNAFSNDIALVYLKKKFCALNCGVLDGRFMHMRCIAHIINLIVQDGIAFVGKAVEKIRACVRFIRQSPARIAKFKTCASLCKVYSKSFLYLDVPTRWNSTYKMLKSACVFEHVFEMYVDEDFALKNDLHNRKMKGSDEYLGVLNDDDWVNIKRVMNFLAHFYELTVRVSGSGYITANTILDEISDTFSILSSNSAVDNELSAMCLKMKEKFDKYWGDISKINLLIFIARIFDPRGKLLLVKYVIGVMYPLNSDVLYDAVEKALYGMFGDYMNMYESSVSNPSGAALSQPPTSLVDEKAPPQRGLLAAQFLQFQSSTQSPKTELEKYLKEELEDSSYSSFSILQWWNQNAQRFPILSRMARDVLVIPISTVSSESAFSTGGRVLSDYKSCLIPTTVESLICVQDWIRNSRTLLELEEVLYEVEVTDEEYKAIGNGEEPKEK